MVDFYLERSLQSKAKQKSFPPRHTERVTSVHTVIGCRGKSMAGIRIEAFSLFTTSIICSYQV